jgi:hypothetical protein
MDVVGWHATEMVLPAGKYTLKNIGVASTDVVRITEIKANTAPAKSALPAGQNEVIVTDYKIYSTEDYGTGIMLIDGSTALSSGSHSYSNGLFYGHIDNFIDFEIKEASIVSVYNAYASSGNETVKIIPADTGLTDTVLNMSVVGWHSTPTTLPAGRYKLKNSGTSSSYRVKITEIKATKVP